MFYIKLYYLKKYLFKKNVLNCPSLLKKIILLISEKIKACAFWKPAFIRHSLDLGIRARVIQGHPRIGKTVLTAPAAKHREWQASSLNHYSGYWKVNEHLKLRNEMHTYCTGIVKTWSSGVLRWFESYMSSHLTCCFQLNLRYCRVANALLLIINQEITGLSLYIP